MATRCVFRIICLLSFSFTLVTAAGYSLGYYEKILRDALFHSRTASDAHTRPTNDHQDGIQVHIQMAVNFIVKLDEKTQTLTVNSLMTYEWMDNRLKWNPRNFAGLEGIHVDREKVWTPDFVPYNSANASNVDIYTNTLLKVHFTGRVTWLTPAITKTTCNLDLARFPFDQHKCSISIGSWTYHGWLIQPILKSSQIIFANQSLNTNVDLVGLGRHQSHNEWQLVKGIAHVQNVYFVCCKEPYPTIDFEITLKRVWSSYVFTCIVPSLLPFIILLSLFCLPSTNGDKIILSGFLFLYQLFLSEYFYWVVPRNGSALPRIIVFCTTGTALVGVAFIIFSVTFILSCSHPRSSIPRLLREHFGGWLGMILCLRLSRIQLGSKDGATPAVDSNRTVIETRNDHDWQTLAVAIERVALVLYIVLIAILFAVTCI